jgi:hypothetical protein
VGIVAGSKVKKSDNYRSGDRIVFSILDMLEGVSGNQLFHLMHAINILALKRLHRRIACFYGDFLNLKDKRRLILKRNIIVASLVALMVVSGCGKEAVDEYAMVTFMLGNVLRNDVSIQIGDIIKEKDVIKTEADSFCDVKIGGSIIRIKEKSQVTMASLVRRNDQEDTTLGLSVGKMLCKPKKLLKSEKFIVKTPTAVAGVRGTNFIVEADINRTTRIKVLQGKVAVAKRVKQFEENIDKVLEVSSAIEKEKKVVITEQEVKVAERKIEEIIKKNEATGVQADPIKLIEETRKDVVIPQASVETFAVADFQKENREIIEVREKEPAVIKTILKALQDEKAKPLPEGRLLVTRYEIYFIKDGKVVWEGRVIENPVRKDDKIFIASGDYVFCASSDGPVLWRKNISNKGRLELKDDRIVVYTGKGTMELDPENGESI